MAHHMKISLEEAKQRLAKNTPSKLLAVELNKAEVRFLNADRTHK